MNKKAKVFIGIISVCIFGYIVLIKCNLNILNHNKEYSNIYYGTVEADQLNVVSEIPGKIKYIRVDEGNKIKKGDLVAVIESNESKIRADQAEIAVKNAQNEVGKVKEGSRQEEIDAQRALVAQSEAYVRQGEIAVKQANNGLNAAKTTFDYRKNIYDKVKALYENGIETKFNLDNAKNGLDIANTSLENAKIALENVKAGFDGFKSQSQASKEKLKLLISGATKRTQNTAEYGVEQNKKSYDIAKLSLDKGNVTAAIGGIVDSINFKIGEYVTPGSPIVTLVDTQNKWVKIYVPEKSLPLISIGKEVSLKSDFLKDKVIKGKISYISSEAEFTPVNIVTKEDRTKLVFTVKIKILDNLEYIKPGMLLEAKIN